MRWTVVPLIVVALSTACSGGDNDDAGSATTTETTTTRPETTTTTAPLSAEERALVAALEDNHVDVGDAGVLGTVIATGWSICSDLGQAARSEQQAAGVEGQVGSIAGEPGADDLVTRGNSLVEEGRSIRDSYIRLARLEARVIYDQFGTETGDLVVRLATEHLCPEHAAFVPQLSQ